MNKLQFIKFQAIRYRSLIDVEVDIKSNKPVIICGENNVGKTNFLRALDLYFNHINNNTSHIFKPEEDIPHHIYYGSRGRRSNTHLIGTFKKNNEKITLKVKFKDVENPEYSINNRICRSLEAKEILQNFKFLFIESNNINLPIIISTALEEDGLLPLDNKRSQQSKPLETLKKFITESRQAIADIEKDINLCFQKFTDFDGVLRGKTIKINFVEYEKLRDVVKTMTEITLDDGNTQGIASKGSGAQRAVFLSLMQFISENSKQSIIWGIDEPEAFLQPKLQKSVSAVFSNISETKNQPIILTTHSQHFININDLNCTHLFEGHSEQRHYERRPNNTYYEINTKIVKCATSHEKAMRIREHLGLSSNDGWEVLPYNIIVEGETDKKYLEFLFDLFNIPKQNIKFTSGASKVKSYLDYCNTFSENLPYKPKYVCIFDNDSEGREQKQNIKSFKFLDVETHYIPRHDGLIYDDRNKNIFWEMEDFIPPKIIIDAVNKILHKNKYKKINQKQINNKYRPANINTQIIEYISMCINQNNTNKDLFCLKNFGRKMEICRHVYENTPIESDIELFCEKQKDFLKQLAFGGQTTVQPALVRPATARP